MEDTKNEDPASTQKSLQPSHDPGWNDPPSWAFTTAGQKPNATTPVKRLLNKRVAFPMNSNCVTTSTSQKSQPTDNLPPPPEMSHLITTAPHKPMVAPSMTNANHDLVVDKEEALKSTLENFNYSIRKLEPAKAEEIQTRLDRMESMWRDNKLDSTVHNKLLEISIALKEDDTDRANQDHVVLMMNHATVCSSWIPGIRQLITEMKNKKC